MLYCNVYFLSGYLMIVTGYPTTVYLWHMNLQRFPFDQKLPYDKVVLRLAVEFISELSSAFP